MKTFCKNALCIFIIGWIGFVPGFSQTSRIDHLQEEIARLEKISGGTVGVGIIHLETGEELMYKDSDQFPMASTYKVPVAVQLLKRVEKGEIRLDSMVVLSESDANHPGSGTLSRLLDDPGVALSVRNLLELMMLISDNSATDMCIKLAGGPEAINNMMRKNGIENISVDRPTHVLIANYVGINWDADKDMKVNEFEQAVEAMVEEEIQRARKEFGKDPRDQSTPSAMAKLLTMIWKGELLNQINTELLLDIMYRCETGGGRIKGILPPGAKVAHKTGTIGGTTNDVGIIDLPGGKGHVVVAAFVKDSEKSVSEREKAIAHISRAVYDYFIFK